MAKPRLNDATVYPKEFMTINKNMLSVLCYKDGTCDPKGQGFKPPAVHAGNPR